MSLTFNITHQRIPGFPNYMASSAGIITKVSTGEPVRTWEFRGYLYAKLYGLDGLKTMAVNRLVTFAFSGEPPFPDYQSAHWDGNRQNNHAANLRWASPQENYADRVRHGTDNAGERHPRAILTEEQVKKIRADYASSGAIAKKYGVSAGQIYSIKTRKAWRHIAPCLEKAPRDYLKRKKSKLSLQPV